MAPTYRPVTVSMPGLPPEVFGAPPTVSFMDAMKEEEALQAQQMNNENNEIALGQKRQLIEALKQRYAGQDPSQFNPDEALQIAQRIAMQSGDLNSALNVERATRERSLNSGPISPELLPVYGQILGADLPPGTSRGDLNTMGALTRAQAYQQSSDTYANDPNRPLRAQKLEKELAGEQIRPLNPAQTAELAEMENLDVSIDNLIANYVPSLSENRAERFLAATVNPNSAAARLKNELNLLATQLAAAYNGKRLSDLDFKTMSALIQINDLDTNETVVDKMNRLKEVMGNRKAGVLSALNRARFNTSGFEAPPGSQSIQTSQPTGGLPRNPDGSRLTREQFMQLRGR